MLQYTWDTDQKKRDDTRSSIPMASVNTWVGRYIANIGVCSAQQACEHPSLVRYATLVLPICHMIRYNLHAI